MSTGKVGDPAPGTKPAAGHVQTYEFSAREPLEVQTFLAKIYAENKFKSTGTKGLVRTRIRTTACADIGLCKVSHKAPFEFEAAAERDSYLVLSSSDGAGTLRADKTTISVDANMSVPISATGVAGITGAPGLSHLSMHFGADSLRSLCAHWIGSELTRPLVFELNAFSPQLEDCWRKIIRAMAALMAMGKPPPIALVSLREHAIGLLLEMHPHNYSRYLRGHRTPQSKVVREAMHFMSENADQPIGVADTAAALGCSVQALHQAFREYEHTTPRAFLYAARLERVREALTTGEGSPVEAASQYGFPDFESFCAAYAERYRQLPGETLRVARGTGLRRETRKTASSPCLPPAMTEMLRDYITANLTGRILVPSLAQRAGLSVQNFIVAFSEAFGLTPAQYVIEERLRLACWMLRNTDESVSAIAAETGFASQSHFTTTLKQREGLTPKQYRKSNPPGLSAESEKSSRIF